MKKHLFLTLAAASITVTASAIHFEDADYFNGKNGNNTPVGQELDATGVLGPASISSSFDFVPTVNDGTANFAIGNPYPVSLGLVPIQGTYTSQLGFQVGRDFVIPNTAVIRFFLRDPHGGGEVVNVNLPSVGLAAGNFSTTVLLDVGGTATIDGLIDSFGRVNYSVTATGGEFVLDAADMQFDARVPDGGLTVALLGFALVGVEGVRRRFSK